MEANELMVNNWIIEPGQDENKPFQIFSIYHEPGNNKINGLPITYFKPITLTENWLIRFGFVNQDVNRYWLDPMYISKFDEGCTYLANQRHVDIFYVHQLQNLYFALTGTELTLKN